ncbi:MAG: secondary thiamine-phosphate synthase enzyme YjbQ [Chlamydiota bacterium]
MTVKTGKIVINTRADGGMYDLTPMVAEELESCGLRDGTATIFCTGSTGAISTVEYEPGLQKDVPAALERIAPKDIEYAHHQTWHDDNGRSHVKATIVGPSLTIPFVKGALTLGTWQQIVFIECDTRDRQREFILQFIGE